MTSSNYEYLSKELGAAVRAMMIPKDNTRAIVDAMAHIHLAAHDLTIEDSVAEDWRRQLMDTIEGGDSMEDTAASMTEIQRSDFKTNTWELWAWAHGDVWESRGREAGPGA